MPPTVTENAAETSSADDTAAAVAAPDPAPPPEPPDDPDDFDDFVALEAEDPDELAADELEAGAVEE